jgi:hypothetical protein
MQFPGSISHSKYERGGEGGEGGARLRESNGTKFALLITFDGGTNLVCTLPFPFETVFHAFLGRLSREISITARAIPAVSPRRSLVSLSLSLSRLGASAIRSAIESGDGINHV